MFSETGMIADCQNIYASYINGTLQVPDSKKPFLRIDRMLSTIDLMIRLKSGEGGNTVLAISSLSAHDLSVILRHMKYSQWLGIVATCTLVASCFFNWTYHPDLDKYFTGFFSEANIYGKPGNVFIFFSVFAVVFFIVPRVWAKRWNFLVAALILAYGIKSFILFTGCYTGICPVKQAGIWVMLFSSLAVMLMAVLPDTKTAPDKEE